jgi:UDP-N-acetylmuramoyl-tripeptide--D-alanyl-D-alanine ligase
MIGITGSIGKSSTKTATVKVLESRFSVDQSTAEYNTELSLFCSVFRQRSGFESVRRWRKAMVGATWNFLTDYKRYDKLVLEMGVAGPGDMSDTLRVFHPEIAIFTGVVPAHLGKGQFVDEQAIFEEKVQLIRTMRRGTAILNRDNRYSRQLEDEDLRADPLWYGRLPENRPVDSLPPGLYFDQLSSSRHGISAEVHVSAPSAFPGLRAASHELSCPILGEHHIYILLPAILTGLVVGLDLEECCDALSTFSLPPGRLNLIPGIGSSTIIDSSWNASPRAVEAALETLGSYPSQRRIALLSCIMNLGEASESAHHGIGRLIPEYAQMLVTVGPEARWIADGARAHGMPAHAIRSFDTSEEAGLYLKDIIRRGDVVLVKGSGPRALSVAIGLLRRKPDAPVE